MAMLKRHASQLTLLIALLLAMTPVWRWAALPASPTFEEVSQLICTAPRAESDSQYYRLQATPQRKEVEMHKPDDAVWPFPSSTPQRPDEPVTPSGEESEAQSTNIGGKAGEDENAPDFIKDRKD